MHRISRLAMLIGGLATAQFAAATAFANDPNKPTTSTDRDRTRTGSDQTGTNSNTGTERVGTTGTMGTNEAGKTEDEMSRVYDHDMTDSELANKIHAINMHEIDMAKLAQTNAASKDVKNYADKLVKDHQDADKKLGDVARKMGVELTSTMTGMDTAHHEKMQRKMDELKGLTGVEFDRHFLITMQKGHDDAILLLSAQSFAHPAGKELRNFVKSVMPTLNDHRKKSIDLLEKIGDKTPAAS